MQSGENSDIVYGNVERLVIRLFDLSDLKKNRTLYLMKLTLENSRLVSNSTFDDASTSIDSVFSLFGYHSLTNPIRHLMVKFHFLFPRHQLDTFSWLGA